MCRCLWSWAPCIWVLVFRWAQDAARLVVPPTAAAVAAGLVGSVSSAAPLGASSRRGVPVGTRHFHSIAFVPACGAVVGLSLCGGVMLWPLPPSGSLGSDPPLVLELPEVLEAAKLRRDAKVRCMCMCMCMCMWSASTSAPLSNSLCVSRAGCLVEGAPPLFGPDD